jgi:hypothetical protein
MFCAAAGLILIIATSGWCVTGDLDDSGQVDIFDVNIFADNWLRVDCLSVGCEGADMSPPEGGDGVVDFNDWSELAANWSVSRPSVDVNSILDSIANEDGRTWGPNSVTGLGEGQNSNDNTEYALRLGDAGLTDPNFGYRDILSFNTSSFLEEGYWIKSAKLQLTKGGQSGTSPFSGWGGTCMVDIASPYFGDSSALEANDWQAEANAVVIATFSDPGANTVMVSSEFTQEGLQYINTNPNGLTQFKVHFTEMSDGDSENDWVSYYSGEATTANRPKLIICHTAPPPIAEFESVYGDDGRVWSDSGMTVGVGADSGASDMYALRLGDYEEVAYGYKSVVSFDTSSLPDDCTILSACVELNYGSSGGTDPFDGWGGACKIDIANPSLGTNATLEASDWETSQNVTAEIATLNEPVSGTVYVSSDFNTAGLGQINKTGKTQLRIYFEVLFRRNDGQGANIKSSIPALTVVMFRQVWWARSPRRYGLL